MFVFKQPFFPLPSNSKSKFPEISRTERKKECFYSPLTVGIPYDKLPMATIHLLLSTHPPICPPIHLPTIYPAIQPSTHLPTHSFIFHLLTLLLAIYPLYYLPICPPKQHPSNYPYTYHPLICLSIYLLTCPPTQPLNHVAIHLPFIHVTIYPPTIHPFIHLLSIHSHLTPIHSSIYQSICPSIHLPIYPPFHRELVVDNTQTSFAYVELKFLLIILTMNTLINKHEIMPGNHRLHELKQQQQSC